jgi:hypothetical protein
MRVMPESLQIGKDLDVVGHSLGVWHPREQSLIAWTSAPETASTGQQTTSGTLYMAGLLVPRAATCTKIYWGTNTAGSGAIAGKNFVSLINSAGTVLASTGVDASVSASPDLITTTIASQSLTPGLYWVSWLFNATSNPSPYRNNFLSGNLANVGIASASSYRYCTNGTGLTGASPMPASVTPANNLKSQYTFWCAIGA